MSHEIDNKRAMYARTPAWHGLGIVKEEGWFTADEALTALGMDEDVTLEPVFVKVRNRETGQEEFVISDDLMATVQWSREEEKYRIHGAGMTKEYGVVQSRQAFRFLDEVVGAIDGSHYEAVGNLRKGRQTFMLIATDAVTLDVGGRNDRINRYILGTNSFDRSLAFRVKFTNVRVECANMLAMALRGSSDAVVEGDWSTKHTSDILNRVEMAQRTLGLYRDYEDEWVRQAQLMIETPMTDDTFTRLLKGLYVELDHDRTGVHQITEKSMETIQSTRYLYELGPANVNVYGTLWGGLQAITEGFDWEGKIRGGKTSTVSESRFRRQLGDTGSSLKQMAWDAFYGEAKEVARV